MGSSSGIAGLKCLQWAFRGIQFGASVVILGIYAYFLATMTGHALEIPTSVKAIVGISAAGVIYTLLGLLICCCAGRPAPSFVSLVLDIGLAAAYVYVAVANRAGAGNCSAGEVDGVYGTGDAGAFPGGATDGMTGIDVSQGVKMPTYGLACRLLTGCLVSACVAIPFFIASVFLEIHINRTRYRHNRPIRDADGEYLNKSEHFGAPPPRRDRRHFKGLGAFRRGAATEPEPAHPDALPYQPQVSDMQSRQVEVAPAWGEVSSLHDSDRLEMNEPESVRSGVPRLKSTTAPGPAAETYEEGDIGDRTFNLYSEDKHGNDGSEVGHVSKHRETKAARMERFAAA